MVTTHREKKHDQRLLLKERSSPYQPNKERGSTYGEQSDLSLVSESSIRRTRAPMSTIFNVKTTPQMTRFRDVKVCKNLLQMKLTITE